MSRPHCGRSRRSSPFAPRRAPPSEFGDLRFRALLGEAAWAALPEATRARFGKRVAHCRTVVYAGEIVECRMSLAGRLLAQAARLIGGPLPPRATSTCRPRSASPRIRRAAASSGPASTAAGAAFPQVIHSSKRFAGPTGLEEYVGRGFGIALEPRWRTALCISSATIISSRSGACGCASRAGWRRAGCGSAISTAITACSPSCWCSPSLFGELIRQTAMFRDPRDAA